MQKLKLAPTLSVPADAVTRTFAILAMRGSGKSNAAVVIAEEMFASQIPFVAIDPKGDWWGIRSSQDGKGTGLAIPIFGGLHGDLPLEPGSGALIAELVCERRLTCLLDVSEFDSKGEQTRFLTDFATRLFRLKARKTFPMHLLLEEADEYIPQRVFKDQARLVGAFSKIIKQGRSRGLGATLITQRSAVLNKDVLTQVDTLIPMRVTAPQDRKAILLWVEHHGLGRELVDSLPELEDGEAWIWSPQYLKQRERIKFRRRRTFDSGATPELGETAKAATLADIDLDLLRGEMASTIERAKADDPRELRAEIGRLKRELDRKPVETWTETAVEKIPVPVITPEMMSAFRDEISTLSGASWAVANRMESFRTLIHITKDNRVVQDRFLRLLRKALRDHEPLPEEVRLILEAVAPFVGTQKSAAPAKAQDAPIRTPSSPRQASGDPPTGAQALKAGARRILATLARHHPMRMTKAQLATLSRFGVRGGTFLTYYSTLRSRGLIEERSGLTSITDAGLDLVGHVPSSPQTPEETLQMWRSALKAGARKMLDVLVERYPEALSREELAERCDMTATGGTFLTYLSTLRRNGLVEMAGAGVRCSETLFLGGVA